MLKPISIQQILPWFPCYTTSLADIVNDYICKFKLLRNVKIHADNGNWHYIQCWASSYRFYCLQTFMLSMRCNFLFKFKWLFISPLLCRLVVDEESQNWSKDDTFGVWKTAQVASKETGASIISSLHIWRCLQSEVDAYPEQSLQSRPK